MASLLVGYKAADLTPELLAGDVICHTLDIYHRHAIENAHHATVICSPHLPEGPWDLVRFKTGPRLMSGELSLDLLQECYRVGKKVEVDFVGRERDRNDLLDKIRNDPKRVRSFRAVWPASVPNGPKLTFTSYPGCFCHRRLDEGGLALAEVVCRDLAAKPEGALPPRILDLGCGCGLVGLLVATYIRDALGRAAPSLTLVDSHSRAVEAAKENAARFGIEAEVAMTDNGIDCLKGAKHSYDVFVGNPPYYSDYRIADVFLDAARKALKVGGTCYTVCKNADGLRPVQERYFPFVETVARRNYSVLRSVASDRACQSRGNMVKSFQSKQKKGFHGNCK